MRSKKPRNSSLCSFHSSLDSSSLLHRNVFLSTVFSNTLSLCPSFNVRDQVSHPLTKTVSSNIILSKKKLQMIHKFQLLLVLVTVLTILLLTRNPGREEVDWYMNGWTRAHGFLPWSRAQLWANNSKKLHYVEFRDSGALAHENLGITFWFLLQTQVSREILKWMLYERVWD
jgi:hypothetical protein